jgi:hypothetical protein
VQTKRAVFWLIQSVDRFLLFTIDNLNGIKQFTLGLHDFRAERLSLSGKVAKVLGMNKLQGVAFWTCIGGYCGGVTVAHYNFSGKTPPETIACDTRRSGYCLIT